MAIKKTQEQFIKDAINIHHNKYDYSKSNYINNATKVLIICNTCNGKFEMLPTSHISYKRGCQTCHNGKSMYVDEFLYKAGKIHQNKYNYCNIKYISYRIKIEIFCNLCQEYFWQTPANHLAGHNCQQCATKQMIQANSSNTEEFIRKAKKIHNDKFGYEKVIYINNKNKVKIYCNICQLYFMQRPHNHLKHGCKKCASRNLAEILSTNYSSHAENTWLDSLNIATLYRQKHLFIDGKRYVVDAYDANTNTIYEFYGDLWHGNIHKYNPETKNPFNKIKYKDLYKNTINRENILKLANFNIISIWESDWINETKHSA